MSRPACCARPPDRLGERRRGLRDERAREPSVGPGADQFQPARRQYGQVDGDLLLGALGQPEHLALPARPGEHVVRPAVGQGFAREGQVEDVEVLGEAA